ncbi:penicillin-binding protein 2 [Terrimonas ferruginea]|uniref:penicillin-binding protein 2 n=1 Tax=Terrimonas ferruginea TaxID=249 RepID=UPI0006864B32|nr:penicillin-binding protein 2 [Terrimonas ferruginea]
MSVFNQSRSRVIRLIFLLVFLIIVGQLVNLQILSGKYGPMAMDNAVYPKIVYPERGIIYDRKGRAVLNNAIMYDLMVTPAEVKNIDTMAFCRMMEIDTADFRKRVNDARFKNTGVRPSIFQSLLTPQMQARFEEDSWRYPGFAMVERPVRVYPFNVAAHILGYINEVDEKDIKRSNNFYRLGDYIGKNGLEATYERVLMGQRGVQYMIKDNRNRLVGSYEKGAFDTAAIAGRSLRTSLDVELQQLAEQLLTDKVGAVVAIDPKTGGILCMASGPTYDPNQLTGPEKVSNYGKLALDVAGPLLNRAIQGRYEPGSTFKPLGGLIALDEGVITPSWGYPCPGRYYGCGSGKPACTHSGGGHAANLRLAIANSCNSYFTHVYRLAVDNPRYGNVKNGYMKWREYMNAFGLGVKLGVDLPSENSGFVPDTAVYNKEYRGAWNSCTNLTLGIGQDKMGATPLQLANAMCIIANRGFYYTPHLVEKIDEETEADSVFVKKYRQRHDVLTHVSDTTYQAIINGMHDVVTMGTARIARIDGIDVCAKTGTAENYTVLDGRRIKLENNSVFVCFAPKENPKIAIAVIVQNAGYGGTWAGPISRILMEKYLIDTLNARSKADLERISKTNKMPSYLKRLQFKTDSIRAQDWLRITKDSTRLKKFLRGPQAPKPQNQDKDKEKRTTVTQHIALLAPDRKSLRQPFEKPSPAA